MDKTFKYVCILLLHFPNKQRICDQCIWVIIDDYWVENDIYVQMCKKNRVAATPPKNSKPTRKVRVYGQIGVRKNAFLIQAYHGVKVGKIQKIWSPVFYSTIYYLHRLIYFSRTRQNLETFCPWWGPISHFLKTYQNIAKNK